MDSYIKMIDLGEFTDEQLQKFKEFMEDINLADAVEIENYISNIRYED